MSNLHQLFMVKPISVDENGIKLKPEIMEKEKLYHCVFNNKVFLVYKDEQEFLNCYEIEEKEIVDKIISLGDNINSVDNILNEFIKNEKLKIN